MTGPFIKASEITPTDVEFLWEDHLPIGEASVIAGDPGLGKSTVLIDLAARVSTGRPMPYTNRRSKPGDVVILSAEDPAEAAIVPRLIAAGADLDRVTILDEDNPDFNFNLDGALDLLAVELNGLENPRLVTIDPVDAFLEKSDGNSNSDVRRIIRDVRRVAGTFGVCAYMLKHLNKKVGDLDSATYRMSGALAWVAAPRAAFLLGKSPREDDDRVVLANVKNNYARTQPSRFLSIEGKKLAGLKREVTRVVWHDEACEFDADQLVAKRTRGPDPEMREEAEQFILARLKGREKGMPLADLMDMAAAEGISASTLYRARKALECRYEFISKNGRTGPKKVFLP